MSDRWRPTADTRRAKAQRTAMPLVKELPSSQRGVLLSWLWLSDRCWPVPARPGTAPLSSPLTLPSMWSEWVSLAGDYTQVQQFRCHGTSFIARCFVAFLLLETPDCPQRRHSLAAPAHRPHSRPSATAAAPAAIRTRCFREIRRRILEISRMLTSPEPSPWGPPR